MTDTTCHWVRDRLPDEIGGRLDDVARTLVVRHLETCPDCRAEAAAIRSLRAPASLPAGLEARVLSAVRERGRANRFVRFPVTRHFAMAATVVFALVTASLLARRDHPVPGEDSAGYATPESPGVVWSAYEDPLLPGGAGLHALSLDELERVLEELER